MLLCGAALCSNLSRTPAVELAVANLLITPIHSVKTGIHLSSVSSCKMVVMWSKHKTIHFSISLSTNSVLHFDLLFGSFLCYYFTLVNEICLHKKIGSVNPAKTSRTNVV